MMISTNLPQSTWYKADTYPTTFKKIELLYIFYNRISDLRAGHLHGMHSLHIHILHALSLSFIF